MSNTMNTNKRTIAEVIDTTKWVTPNGRHPEPTPEMVLPLWDKDERGQDDKRKHNSGKFMVQIMNLFAKRDENHVRFDPAKTYMTINSSVGEVYKTPKTGKESVMWEVSTSIFDMATDKRLYRIVYKDKVNGKSAVYGATDEEFLAGPDWRTDVADWMKCTKENAAAKESATAEKAKAKELARLAKIAEKAKAKEAKEAAKAAKAEKAEKAEAKAAMKKQKAVKKTAEKVVQEAIPAPACKVIINDTNELDIDLDEFENEEFNV